MGQRAILISRFASSLEILPSGLAARRGCVPCFPRSGLASVRLATPHHARIPDGRPKFLTLSRGTFRRPGTVTASRKLDGPPRRSAGTKAVACVGARGVAPAPTRSCTRRTARFPYKQRRAWEALALYIFIYWNPRVVRSGQPGAGLATPREPRDAPTAGHKAGGQDLEARCKSAS